MIGNTDKRSILAALGAAVLFGAGTPAAKLVLGQADPWLVAGLLYLGSGTGLLAWRIASRQPRARLQAGELKWLAAAIAAGGIVGPILLMYGLSRMPASGASLLLNAEGVFTALLAWFVFRENFDRRIALGMFLIVIGAAAIAWPKEAAIGELVPSLAVLGACLAWAIDNNLTRKVALADATFVAMSKGLAAGVVGATMVIGLLSYGLSLTLFVLALRGLGTARTGAYFSIAPFAGAMIAFGLLGEPITAQLAIGGALMAAGVWLHLTERHEHGHTHQPMVHSHEHEHDEHHRHDHSPDDPAGERHTHEHSHPRLAHSHPHFPDSHHRHEH